MEKRRVYMEKRRMHVEKDANACDKKDTNAREQKDFCAWEKRERDIAVRACYDIVAGDLFN